MLRYSLARKALRTRAITGLRRAHDARPQLQPPPSSLAARAQEHQDLYKRDENAPPLYTPPPPPPEVDMTGVELDENGLPSESWVKRQTKRQIVQRAIEGIPEYDEEALRTFYKQVVLSGAPKAAEDLKLIGEPAEGPMTKGERMTLLAGLAERFKAQPEGEEGKVNLLPAFPPGAPEHVALTAALLEIAPDSPPSEVPVPLGLVRKSEWQALFESFLDRSDAQGAEVLLSTMQRHGTLPTKDQLDKVVEVYARRGQTTEVARLISDFNVAGLEINDNHRDLLISSYLHRDRPDHDGAIAILTASENMGKPFPQSSYNVVISHLTEPTITNQTDSHSRALAWDLFTHMRLAAHPTPTRELYTTMIRACSDSADPQPERARDLWIEMTTDVSAPVEPRREEFDAIIRALGSTKNDYLEAYDLLRQMLAKHHDATFVPFTEEDSTARMSPWVPTVETFTALLEGTKRAADLDRARWALSEVVDLARGAAFTGTGDLKGPNEELMANVFQTYAAWDPPITRQSVTATTKQGVTDETTAEQPQEAEEGPSALVERENRVEADMPRTSAEALREADLLFERVVHDARAALSGPANVVHYPFCGVHLTPRLVNSYLAVQLKHSRSYADARATCERVWSALSELPDAPRPNGWTYLQIMNRCARGKLSKDDRAVAFAWGNETWKAYREWYKASLPSVMDETSAARRKRWLVGLGERQTEKMWVLAIRLLSLQDDVDGALKLLDEFVELYPPKALVEGYTPKLKTPGFVITMMDPSEVAEPNLPPHLLFKDVDVLHQRCVRDEKWDGVNKIKYATTAYVRCLGKRRKFRIRSVGVERELGKREKKNPAVRPGSLRARIGDGDE